MIYHIYHSSSSNVVNHRGRAGATSTSSHPAYVKMCKSSTQPWLPGVFNMGGMRCGSPFNGLLILDISFVNMLIYIIYWSIDLLIHWFKAMKRHVLRRKKIRSSFWSLMVVDPNSVRNPYPGANHLSYHQVGYIAASVDDVDAVPGGFFSRAFQASLHRIWPWPWAIDWLHFQINFELIGWP